MLFSRPFLLAVLLSQSFLDSFVFLGFPIHLFVFLPSLLAIFPFSLLYILFNNFHFYLLPY